MSQTDSYVKSIKAFTSLINDQINVQDINTVLESQRQILIKLDMTNSNLVAANKYSNEIFVKYAQRDFQAYSTLLLNMKQDLEFIFKKIKTLKSKLELKHSLEYKEAVNHVIKARKESNGLGDDEDESAHFSKTMDDEDMANQSDSLLSKERTTSMNSTTSSGSAFAGIIEKARNRSKELVNDLITSRMSNSRTDSPRTDDHETKFGERTRSIDQDERSRGSIDRTEQTVEAAQDKLAQTAQSNEQQDVVTLKETKRNSPLLKESDESIDTISESDSVKQQQ